MAKFYSARSKTIPPLPWLTFALTFSKDDTGEYKPHHIHCGSEPAASLLHACKVARSTINGFDRQYILLDEIDQCALKTQAGVMAYMDQRAGRTIFMFTTNHLSKVQSGIRDRCHLISFENPSADLWKARVKSMIKNERVEDKFTDDDIEQIITKANGSARGILAALRLHVG